MADRFDLEEKIMSAWHVTDDLKVLIDNFDSSSKDELLNVLIGIHSLYGMKFNKLFDVFETVIANGELTPPILNKYEYPTGEE